MLLKSINDMLNQNNSNHIFVHNFSKFEDLFLSKILFFYSFKVNPLYKDSNILSLKIKSRTEN